MSLQWARGGQCVQEESGLVLEFLEAQGNFCSSPPATIPEKSKSSLA